MKSSAIQPVMKDYQKKTVHAQDLVCLTLAHMNAKLSTQDSFAGIPCLVN